MASTRLQQINILQNTVVQAQLAGCLLFAAINVSNEPVGTANHVNRLAWAKLILNNPLGQSVRIINYIMTNATLAANAGNALGASGTPFLDSDLDFFVASMFDQLSTQFASV